MSHLIEIIDGLLNRITMYRLVLYYLIALLGIAVIFSFLGILAYDPFALLFSIGFFLAVCSITNWIFARTYGIPANLESSYITALILALIITPYQTPNDLWFFLWAGVLAIASKYIIAIRRSHIFNPVAFAVAVTYLTVNQTASWWIGSAPMLPFVLIGGILVARRIERFELVAGFFAAALVSTLALGIFSRENFFATLTNTVFYSPLFFFAFVILTEPRTTPPTGRLRILYGAMVGALFAPQLHFGSVYMTPELAILAGNVLSFLASPRQTLILRLVRKVQLSPDVYDFIFAPSRKLAFKPGQYMEWTLGHPDPDTRGNRRYFTLASAPTEENLRLGVKFYPESSSFKQAMLGMDGDAEIVAAHPAGDFVLPRNPKTRCVFIAGGIGITPFRSMLKYLLDRHEARPIVLFYANRTVNDFVYVDVLERAQRELGIRTLYTVMDRHNLPASWQGRVGYITADAIRKEVPDYAHCVYYISGPLRMIESFQHTLNELHVPQSQIKTDYFAGLA